MKPGKDFRYPDEQVTDNTDAESRKVSRNFELDKLKQVLFLLISAYQIMILKETLVLVPCFN